MDTGQKLDMLKEVHADEIELDQVLEKLLSVALDRQRQRLKRYEAELSEFETRYGMDSASFYERFEAGELGDAMDFCEWAGVFRLRQDLRGKIHRLGSAM